ncbi:MAG: sulfotransferase family 2 domain-containing protein [Rhodospirillales bacterium]|nr:sulfotransferase family 2 domain-containing protein [Rhodospirillales bacterium]
MSDSEQDPFYLFLHIPKTADTTLRSIVDQNLGPENILTYYNQNSRQLLDNLDAHLTFMPNFRAIIGHFKFGLHKLLNRPSTYITFLLHPVARTISQYKEFFVNHPHHLQDSDGNILSLTNSDRKKPKSVRKLSN